MPVTNNVKRLMKKFEILCRRTESRLIFNLQKIGEDVVSHARQSHTYTDRTGNLTSSMGYALVVDGRIRASSGFEVVRDGAEGVAEGQAYAKELANQHPQGIVLIVVAGRQYASYVADRGFDVLDGAETLAGRLVPQMLARLQASFVKSFNSGLQ